MVITAAPAGVFAQNNVSSGGSQSAVSSGFYVNWDQHYLIAGQSGEIKVGLHSARSYENLIDNGAYLRIVRKGGAILSDTSLVMAPVMGNPRTVTLHPLDTQSWNLYGSGPFEIRVGGAARTDAIVRRDHRYRSEIVGVDCSECCPCKHVTEYYYDGLVDDEIFGEPSKLIVRAYDWGKRFGFSPEQYVQLYRSYIKFNLDWFNVLEGDVLEAELAFLAYGSPADPAGPSGYRFHITPVSEAWTADNLMWYNQPNTQSNREIILSNPPVAWDKIAMQIYRVPMTIQVRDWIARSNTNYGLQLRLEEENMNLSHGNFDVYKKVEIPVSEGVGAAPFSPELNIVFTNPNYNPTTPYLNAGYVEAGDTLMVTYHNGSPNPNSALKGEVVSISSKGSTVPGYVLPFEDRDNGLNRPADHSAPELLKSVIYIE